jgi:Na+/melibiose symporter-like transporter
MHGLKTLSSVQLLSKTLLFRISERNMITVCTYVGTTCCTCWIVKKREFPPQIFKNTKYQISWKSVQWELSCSMLMDGRTVRHDKANSRFSQFCERAQNLSHSTHSVVFMCFVWISEQTAIISLYNINWLICITETQCVYCAVRSEYLSLMRLNTAQHFGLFPGKRFMFVICCFLSNKMDC